VRYNVLGWLEKNKDPINDSAVGVLKSSGKGNTLIKTIWLDYQTQEEQLAGMGVGGRLGAGVESKNFYSSWR